MIESTQIWYPSSDLGFSKKNNSKFFRGYRILFSYRPKQSNLKGTFRCWSIATFIHFVSLKVPGPLELVPCEDQENHWRFLLEIFHHPFEEYAQVTPIHFLHDFATRNWFLTNNVLGPGLHSQCPIKVKYRDLFLKVLVVSTHLKNIRPNRFIFPKLSGHTLLKTNIAMENPPFWCYLLGKMVIFMGHVSFREGNMNKNPSKHHLEMTIEDVPTVASRVPVIGCRQVTSQMGTSDQRTAQRVEIPQGRCRMVVVVVVAVSAGAIGGAAVCPLLLKLSEPFAHQHFSNQWNLFLVNTPQKFNVEPESGGFQYRNHLFQGSIFRFSEAYGS